MPFIPKNRPFVRAVLRNDNDTAIMKITTNMEDDNMKSGRRFLSALLVLLILVTSAPMTVGASIVDSGTCGDHLTWTLDSDGTLTISGTGAMKDYSTSSSPFPRKLKSIKINSGVTSIGGFAFSGCSNLTSVTVPNNVTSIAQSTFERCQSLISVTIGSSVKSIGDFSFHACYNLKSVTIPNSVTSIGNWAFGDCGLMSLKIGNKVKTIGECAFMNCNNLTNVTIPNSVTSIGPQGFSDCDSLTSITIPISVTSIGRGAFGACFALSDVYYNGSRAQWDRISIGDYNECLTNAAFHFDFTFTLGRDNNSFYHWASDRKESGFYSIDSYTMKDKYRKKLKSIPKVNKNEIDKEIDKKWGGSCFGISSAIGLTFMELLSASDFIKDMDTFYALGKPCNDPDFLSKINYLHLLQCLMEKI